MKIHNKTLGEILQPHEIHSIATAAKFQEYRPGQVIVKQGDVGDAFYMVERGCVDVYIRDSNSKQQQQHQPQSQYEDDPQQLQQLRLVVTLKAGDFFGEKALLSSDVRTATCVASSSTTSTLENTMDDGKQQPQQQQQQGSGGQGQGSVVAGVKCLLLMREDFVRMLGDLEYLLDRSYEMRDGSDRLSLTSGGGGLAGVSGSGKWKEDGLVHPMGEK